MAKTREEITSNIDDMKQYLKDCYLLAKEWDCAERQIAEINRRINGLGHKHSYEQPYGYGVDLKSLKSEASRPSRESFGVLVRRTVLGVVGGVLLGSILFSVVGDRIGSETGVILSSGIIGFLISVSSYIKYIKDEKRFADEWLSKTCEKVEKYEQEIKRDERRVQNELARIPKYRELEKIYSQNSSISLNALNRLLDLDIIFPKYRNLVAISQIYEYFMSGRCTELEGPHGAYNLYESEMRMNIIITQLDTVIYQLEQIKQAQYMLYSAISETNARLANIESNTAAAAYNTSVIAANSEIIARYYK